MYWLYNSKSAAAKAAKSAAAKSVAAKHAKVFKAAVTARSVAADTPRVLLLKTEAKICRVCVKRLKDPSHNCVFQISRTMCNACAKLSNKCPSVSNLNAAVTPLTCIQSVPKAGSKTRLKEQV